jgi:hypothetical protein
MPVYEACGPGEDPPHLHQPVLPETTLLMGTSNTQKRQVKVLLDTGAYYNIMTIDTAKSLGAKLMNDRHFPTLALADGSLTGIMGRVLIPVEFAKGVTLRTEFYVLSDSPTDAILGSHFMDRHGVRIQTASRSFTIQIGCKQVTLPTNGRASYDTPQEVTPMYATTSTVVPAGTEMFINIGCEPNVRRMEHDTWGIISDAKQHGVMVATGFTCALADDDDAHYYCKVVNASDKDVTLTTEKALAAFEPTRDRYDIAQWDEESSRGHGAATTGLGVPTAGDYDDRRAKSKPE